jgi:uncharacterized membrane protein
MPDAGDFMDIAWDVFLAIIPVALGWLALAIGLRTRRWTAWLLLPPVLLAWLAFLPNSCYLFTETRHFMRHVDARDLWSRAAAERGALLAICAEAAVMAVFLVSGALTFGLAIRPVRKLAEARGLRFRLWALPLFAACSLAVYLGLVVRLNSWQIVTAPAKVLQSVQEALSRPFLVLVILAFALFLWAVYWVVDVWLDGFAARWQARTERESATFLADTRPRAPGQTAATTDEPVR